MTARERHVGLVMKRGKVNIIRRVYLVKGALN